MGAVHVEGRCHQISQPHLSPPDRSLRSSPVNAVEHIAQSRLIGCARTKPLQ